MKECSKCIVEPRERGSSVHPGRLWEGHGMFGDWERCGNCAGTGFEPESGYQVVIDNQVRHVEDLTREELISELIMAIDKLEELDELQIKMKNLINDWRIGS